MKDGKKQMIAFLATGLMTGCASMRSLVTPSDNDTSKPISNPFAEYKQGGSRESNQPMVLRTKKGDRSVEVELPGDAQSLSDFVIPISPAFKNSKQDTGSSPDGEDIAFKAPPPTVSDHEITSQFPQGSAEDDGKRKDIEKALNLAPSEEGMSSESTSSYLSGVDHIKQLYRGARYEAALVETDGMIRLFPTDPKLYEMRGTLMDRLGKRDLAVKSWEQALHFDPNNQSLKKFIERKQNRSVAGEK